MILVSSVTHPALGPALRLTGLSTSPLILSHREAQTIAAALRAVRDGRSRETEIYLSPIASDDDFQALIEADGVRCHGQKLDWAAVDKLAADLARDG